MGDKTIFKQEYALRTISIVIIINLLISMVIIIPSLPLVTADDQGTVTIFEGSYSSVTRYFSEYSSSETYIVIPSEAVVTDVSFQVTNYEYMGSSTTNLALYLGYEDVCIWSYDGVMEDESYETVDDIVSAMNDYLDGVYKVGSTTSIPLYFYSETTGKITLSSLDLDWVGSDFTISSASCDSYYDIGEFMNISFTADNDGSASADHLIVAVYVDSTSSEANCIGRSVIEIDSDSTNITFILADTLYSSTGTHDIILVINPDEFHPEPNYNNNDYTIENVQFYSLDQEASSSRRYDFQIEELSYPMYHQYLEEDYIEFTVVNYGWGSATDIDVDVHLDDVPFDQDEISYLDGYMDSDEVSIPISTLSTGNYEFDVYIDYYDDYTEELESNNYIEDSEITCGVFEDTIIADIPIDEDYWISSDLTEVPTIEAGPCEGKHFYDATLNVNSVQNNYRMISPVINFLEISQNEEWEDVFLSFYTCYNFPEYGDGKVDINISGQHYQVGNTLYGDSDDEWEYISIDISNFYNVLCSIEFLYDSDGETSSQYYWYIDDIAIEVLNFRETAESIDTHWFGDGHYDDWYRESWDVVDAYEGSGDQWEIDTIDSSQAWVNEYEANSNNEIVSNPFYIPPNDSTEFIGGQSFDPKIIISHQYNFGQTADTAQLDLKYVDIEGWHHIFSFEGASEGPSWDTAVIDLPDMFTGEPVVARVVIDTGDTPYTGPDALYAFQNWDAGLFPDKWWPDGFKLMTAKIGFNSGTAIPAPVTFDVNKGLVLAVDDNTDSIPCNLQFQFTENPVRSAYYDKVFYGYRMSYRLSDNSLLPKIDKNYGTPTSPKEIDENGKFMDSQSPNYNSWGYFIEFEIDVDDFLSEGGTGFEVEFKVRSGRAAWKGVSSGSEKLSNVYLDTMQYDLKTQKYEWDVLLIQDTTEIDTAIMLSADDDDAFEATPLPTSGQYGNAIDDLNYVYWSNTQLTFNIQSIALEERDNSQEEYVFFFEVYRDDDLDNRCDVGELVAEGEILDWDDSPSWPWDPEEVDSDDEDFHFTVTNAGTHRFIIRTWWEWESRSWLPGSQVDDTDNSPFAGQFIEITIVNRP